VRRCVSAKPRTGPLCYNGRVGHLIPLVFGLGGTELIVIGLIILVLFGSRLPKAARGFGQSIKEFKKGVREGSGPDSEDAPRQIEHGAGAPIDAPAREHQSRRD
jgi:sec-independent protein translocase protein TatA